MNLLGYLDYALWGVGAASVLALGVHGALALIAPKTATDADDKALGFMDKVIKGLGWIKSVLDTLALNLKSKA